MQAENGRTGPIFEDLQRPDNHLEPYRNTDPKSLFCCGIADTLKIKFKVEPGNERYPEDRWHAWPKDEWATHFVAEADKFGRACSAKGAWHKEGYHHE